MSARRTTQASSEPNLRTPAGSTAGTGGRTGRRRGNPDTRQAILRAARAAFAASGFDGASVRRIAADAGVDPALVHHYFGSKDQLFLATVQVPPEVFAQVSTVGSGGLDGFGERLVRTVLTVWGSPAGSGLVAALRSAVADPARMRSLREFAVTQILGMLVVPLRLPPDEVERRVGLVASQVLGVLVGRFVMELPPLLALDQDTLVTHVGATVQRYLTEPLAPSTASTPPPPADHRPSD